MKKIGGMTLLFIIVLALFLLINLFFENKILGTIIVFGIVGIIVIGIAVSYYEDKEKEKRTINQALKVKRIKQEQEAKRIKQEKEIKKLKQIKKLARFLSEYILQRSNNEMLLTKDMTFDNKDLTKAILKKDKSITIDDFFKKILLCDKLKMYNKKFIFDDYVLIFNGSYMKTCKIKNLKVSSDYINISSYNFNYTSIPFSSDQDDFRGYFSITENGFTKYVLFINRENCKTLKNHIDEIMNTIKCIKQITPFIDLKKFDYENYFKNETMNNIIKILTKDIHFYASIKNDNLDLSNEEKLADYYIYLKNEYEKWKNERTRIINQLQQQLRRLYEEKYTAENSVLFNKLVELNQEYKSKENSAIAQICKEHIFEIECKSKTEFDRFNFNKYVIGEIRKNTSFYYLFPKVIKEIEDNFEWYSKEYDNLKKLYSMKEDSYNFEIAYKEFKFNEYKLFQANKMNPPIYPTMKIELKYTTPSLRYSYDRKINFEYGEILSFIEKSKEPSKSELKKQEMKDLRDKVRNLEEQLKQMQQGQIYSIENEEQSLSRELRASNNISTSLTHFRILFENGEISREEYEQKRKELMG